MVDVLHKTTHIAFTTMSLKKMKATKDVAIYITGQHERRLCQSRLMFKNNIKKKIKSTSVPTLFSQ